MPSRDDDDESGHQARFHHPAQDDHLRQTQRDDRHHEGQHRPQRDAFVHQTLTTGMIPAALEYSGTPRITAAGTVQNEFLPRMFRQKIVGDETVNERADGDADDHVQPDFADDLAGAFDCLDKAFVPGQPVFLISWPLLLTLT